MKIRNLDPPGRFMKRKSEAEKEVASANAAEKGGKKDGSSLEKKLLEEDKFEWEELSDERALHKACQVMRDLQRPDRKDRKERKKLRKAAAKTTTLSVPGQPVLPSEGTDPEAEAAAAVAETVAAAAEAIDNSLPAESTAKNVDVTAEAAATMTAAI